MREFPIGSLRQADQLPKGRLRSQLETLPLAAQERALRWLRSFHFTKADVPSLHADAGGGILYSCAFAKGDPVAAQETPSIAEAAAPVSPFPSSLVFHSKPGAANVLYLNFTGETVTNTQWNAELSRAVIPAVAFSTDADLATFSDAEQGLIKRVWQRVAEDYAPFDIDVTTERPASFATRTAMALVTRTTDANGESNPYSTAGGVAYVNVFGTSTYATYRPAWIYHNNLANDESYIAEAASHETGHNMGLSHDGQTDGTEYYGGHGVGDISWGPLMGTGYNRNVSQWSKGEYYLANNTQDDLGTLAGKLTYRADDHGATPGAATALAITGGTNILATTPENDPANTNQANKGVLERNTDVDVFSFVTGSGPVSLAVNPWIQPSGTRGGNTDIALALYNEAGALLLTNNPALQTTALIQTNLIEGRYFLYVRSAGTGDPLSSTPTGYTLYGSIGRYFISGCVTEAPSYVAPPVAELQATNLTQPAQTTKQFSVTYSDDVAVDVSTIDSSDILVTGPNAYSQLAQFVSLNTAANGTPRAAVYSVSAPGGVWLPADNGVYEVWMRASQVGDTEGAFVAARQLGQFQVAVPVSVYAASMEADPGWTLEPKWQHGTPAYSSGGPTGGFSGAKIVAYNLSGPYERNLAPKYATTPPIDCSGSTALTLRFMRWLRVQRNDTASIQVSTNGVSWLNLWSSSNAVLDTAWQSAQYALPAAVAGSSALRVRWGIGSNQDPSTDLGWNLDEVELLGDGALDSAPPVAALSVADLSMGGSPTHSCSVTCSDATAVRLSSLDSADLLVTGPNGYSNLVDFVGADLPSDGSPITATYSIPAPGGTWNASNNGTYAVTLMEGAVEDVLHNATPQATLGSFDVSISTASPGVLMVLPLSGLASWGPAGGPFAPTSNTYTLTNTGDSTLTWTASKAQEWISLSCAGGSLAPGESCAVTVSINENADALPPGGYSDTAAFVNATTGDGNTGRSVALTVTGAGILEVSPTGDLSAAGGMGGPFNPAAILYTLANVGSSSLDWVAGRSQSWVGLSATNGTLAAGASTTLTVSINAEANSLATGSYLDTLTLVNTSTGAGTTSRTILLTVAGPGLLEVLPGGGLICSGPAGGPFSPSSIAYALTNAGGSSLNWTASKTQGWVNLDPTNGTLAAGASATLTVSIDTEASSLAAGSYSDTVHVANASTGLGGGAFPVALSVLPAVATRPAWRWSNPTPHGANIVDVAFAGGLAVQVGERGQIFTSTDFDYWTPRDSHTDRSLRGVVFFGGRIVISGESGTILFADDPAEFYLNDLGTSDWLESVAVSTNLVVAVGDNGAVYTSTNAVTWIRRNTGYTTWLRSVAWGPAGFVAVGENGFIMSSSTGNTWNQRTSTVSQNLNRVAWIGDRYWVVGDGGKVLTSTTGASWSPQTTGATNYLYATAGSTNAQLAAGEREVRLKDGGVWTNELRSTKTYPPPVWNYYSALWDSASFWLGGETGLWVQGYKTNQAGEFLWYVPSPAVRTWLWGVTRTPHFYLAVGDRGTVMASDNGVDWDMDLVPDAVTNTIFLGVDGSTNRFLAVGNAGAIIYSSNGVTWEAVEPRPTTNDLQGVAASGDLFLVTGAKGTVLTSRDGAHWTRQTTPTVNFLSSAAAFPGGFVAVGDNGAILTSANGTNWTSRSVATTNWFWQVRYLNGVLLLVGENGALRTSTDGTNWSARTSGTSQWLTDAAFVDGSWFAVGTGGTVLRSTNLTAWASVGTLTRNSLFGAAVSGGQLLTVGVEGIILRSQIVPDPTPIQFVQYGHTTEHNVFLFGGKPDQRFLLNRSPDLFFWLPWVELEFTDGTGTLLWIEEAIPGLTQEFYQGAVLP